MALVVLRLKLALQRRAWGASRGLRRTSFVAGWLLSLLAGVAVAELVALTQRDSGEAGGPTLVLLLTAIYLCWVVLPVLVPGLADTSVDPEKLSHFPVRSLDQALGLTLGALLSPTALCTLLAAVGGAVDGSLLPAVAVVGLALVYVVLCVTSSRAVQALLAGLLHRRRAREVIAGTVVVLGALAVVVTRAASRDDGAVQLLLDPRFTGVAGWMPPGAMAEAIAAARDASWATAATHAAVGVAAVAVALAAWTWAIGTSADRTSTGPRQRREGVGRSEQLRLTVWPLGLVPPHPAVAAASQQVRYALGRSPQAMQLMVVAPVLGVATAHTVAQQIGLVAGAVAFAAFAFTLVGVNVFSFDGTAFTYLVTAGAPYSAVLRGKTWAPMLLLGPVAVVFVVVEAGWTGAWPDSPAAVVAALTVGASALSIGALLSVRRPLNLVARSRGGLHGLVTTLSGFVGVGVLLGIGGFLWSVVDDSVGNTTVALILALGSVPVLWVLNRLAGHAVDRDPWRVERALA